MGTKKYGERDTAGEKRGGGVHKKYVFMYLSI